MTGDAPTVVFFPEGAYGPTNNCIGIGNVLRERGVRVVFVIEESFKGTLATKGFEEQLMRLKPPPEVPEQPGQFWKDFIRDTAPEFRRSTLEQIETLIKPIWSELISGSIYVNDRLREIFASVRPDVIVQDNVVAFGAVLTAGVPWVRIVSCNPLEISDGSLPPPLSGLTTDDAREWGTFREAYAGSLAQMHTDFNSFLIGAGCPPLPEHEFMYQSPYLNLYNYPNELDYPRLRRLGSNWVQLQSCVRTTDKPFSLQPISGR
ncbi:MAG TPA: glycosyl transferase, partial [Candidatus Dormibacteraeota bacterium]|nr:glycosyl transferase [Candidatus Dormibacteraeota bacterium]